MRNFNVHVDSAEGWDVNGPYKECELCLVLAGLRLLRKNERFGYTFWFLEWE